MAKIVSKLEVDTARAKVIIGYSKSKDEVHFFEGEVKGRIVEPRGDGGFGWNPLFLPDGYSKTFGEMSRAEKNKISMRKIAFTTLKEFLEK